MSIPPTLLRPSRLAHAAILPLVLAAGAAVASACGSSDGGGGEADPGDSAGPLGDSSVGRDGAVDASPGDGSAPDTRVPPADAPWDAKLPPTPKSPELWYWHHSYLSVGNDKEPANSEALIDQAVAAGYTGLALWDSSQSYVQKPDWDSSKLKTVIAYAIGKGLAVLPSTAPFGYSYEILQTDPNLAEGQRVVGTKFKVTGGKLVLQNEQPPLPNGDMETPGAGFLSYGDPRVSRDTAVFHSGTASAHISGSATASDNARLAQVIDVTPWRLHHLRFWAKSQDLARNRPTVNVFDPGTGNPSRFYLDLDFTGTHDWTQIDVTFNSNASTKLAVYIGMWGGNSGDLWVDDVSFEQTAFVNLIRRDGAPLKVYDAATTYAEGTDYARIEDPKIAGAHFDGWHDPPVPTVPSGSKLTEGMVVSIDHYTIEPIYGFEVGACLTEPAVQTWEAANVKALDALFPKESGFFLQYDEMRHMDSCAKCKATGMAPGALLAWHVGVTADAVDAVRPGAQLYVWNDMFDPNHNAHDDYFNVEGDIAGSWAGLRAGTVVMNWIRKPESLKFFSGTDPKQPHPFRQILAGYYDSGDGKGSAASDLAAAKGVPGVVGAMYTCWNDGCYGQLAQYAQGIKDGWAAYSASVP